MVYTDSKTIVSILTEGCSRTNACHVIVSTIHEVHGGSGDITWQYTYREANQVADAFAKFGLLLDGTIRIFDCPPPFVSNALRANVSFTCFPRGF